MVTIVLTVSRHEYLEKVITRIELLECLPEEISILCIVDGDDELYIKTRNLVNGMKFRERLTVRLDAPGKKSNLDIASRRKRIAAAHNQARSLLSGKEDYVFSVEDDTTFAPKALQRLLKVANDHPACAMVEGVELGRWGVPYIGAWIADDVYDPKTIKSVENILEVESSTPPLRIDAGGLYCALIKADLYRNYTFASDNGLGPDINFGIDMRQLGYDNFLVWQVPCGHHYMKGGVEKVITPRDETAVVTLTKQSDTKWLVSY